MALIKSISGIRGTIGGAQGDSLTPFDILRFTAGYAKYIISQNEADKRCAIVVGRDARISGEMVDQLVCGTLLSMGVDVINLGLTTTPTTEMAVVHHQANGGIILTADRKSTRLNSSHRT